MITSLLFAVPIVQRFGPKVGLIGASWTYMIFVAARSLPSDWKAPRLAAMYCTAFGVGAGGAVLWTSIGSSPALYLKQRNIEFEQAHTCLRWVRMTLSSPNPAVTISMAFFLLMASSRIPSFWRAQGCSYRPTACTCFSASFAHSDVSCILCCPNMLLY